MCVTCGHRMGEQEMAEYRKFALLNNQDTLVKQSTATEQLAEKKTNLMTKRKLVLVLDLDNTLIHAASIPYRGSQLHKQRTTKPVQVDEVLGIYEVFLNPQSVYAIKCRPHLKDFIARMNIIYEIYFYTAGTRDYGLQILEIIRLELSSTGDKSNFIKDTNLIGRDDIEKYESQEEHLEKFVERQLAKDGPKRFNYVLKSLKSLAGDDDSIFVILDDSSVVWEQEIKEEDGTTKKQITPNLLVIPAYYWHNNEQTHKITENQTFYKRMLKYAAMEKDLDPTLLFYGKALAKIHALFYQMPEALRDVKPIVRKYRSEVFKSQNELSKAIVLSLLYSKTPPVCFEMDVAKSSGLEIHDSLADDMDRYLTLFLCKDYVDGNEEKKIASMRNSFSEEHVKCISVLWLYFSYNWLFSLDLQAFEQLENNVVFKGVGKDKAVKLQVERVVAQVHKVMEVHFPGDFKDQKIKEEVIRGRVERQQAEKERERKTEEREAEEEKQSESAAEAEILEPASKRPRIDE